MVYTWLLIICNSGYIINLTTLKHQAYDGGDKIDYSQ